MKIVHEMRERRAFEPPKSNSPLPIIIGAVIAFGIGALGVSGIIKMPTFNQGPKTMAIAVPAAAVREQGSGRDRVGTRTAPAAPRPRR